MYIKDYRGIRVTIIDINKYKEEVINPLSSLPNYP